MNRPVLYRMVLGALALILVIVISVPTYAQGDHPEVTNSTCPVTRGEPIDPTKYLEYNGQRVYFCCDRCLKRFEANPSRYAEDLAQVMPEPVPKIGVADTHDHDSPGVQDNVDSAHHHDSSAEQSQMDGHTTGAAPRHEAGGVAPLEDTHDHSAHEAEVESSFFPRLINWLGKFHPPTTHFPIGLLTAAVFAEILFIKTKRPLFDHAAQFCVWIGAAGALAGAALGWFYAGFHLVDENWILTTHRWLGTSVALASLAVAWLCIASHLEGKQKLRKAYRIALLLTVSLVGPTGFLGGAMIYGIDHYAW